VVSNSASEWLADSYFFQSRAKLDEALKAARKAVAHSPNFGFGWARVAELEFSFGRIQAASDALDKALKLSPRNAEAVSLKGFLLAAKGKSAAARQQFDEAIVLDGALGNAWLGRGLVRIHSGDAAGGRQDLQVAATVEPQRAILRSYLGKAFANVRDGKHAEKEFALAQKLDPNDPTVWLYSALLNEQENKVNDAVRDLEKSQALNDNRKVYRSQLLLDQDRAVRGANLANIYRDAGMTDTGVREAVAAVNSDYANYSSHQFLADNYFNLLDRSGVNLRYETAFNTEYLVANLLAPVGAGTLSPQVSQQEYSKLFERDHVGVSSDTTYLSHGDWRQSAVEYGNFGNTAFAFEQDYSSTHGYRPNSDQEDTLYDFKIKQQLTPKDSAFVEVELRDTTGGNTAQYYNPATAANEPFRFTDRQQPLVVAGLHHEWSPGVDTLLLVSRLSDSLTSSNPFAPVYLIHRDLGSGTIDQLLPTQTTPFAMTEVYRSRLEIYSAEAQQIWQTHRFTTIVGARWQTGEFETDNFNQNFLTDYIDLFTTDLKQNVSAKFNRENVYAYEHWQALDSLRFIGGVSYDRLVMPENFRYAPVSGNTETHYHLLPKAGVIWTPLAGTTVRAGYSQSVGGASIDQSFQLEPSQVAGFNQAFRSLIPESFGGANAGATFTTYGISLEQKLPTRTYLALLGEILQSSVNRVDGAYEFSDNGGPFNSGMHERLDFTEWALTGSAHQLLGRDWSLGLMYRLAHARLEDRFPEISPDVAAGNDFIARSDLRGLLHTLDLSAVYQNPCGFFARADALWRHQNNAGYATALAAEDFWQVNLQAGWRFFHRRAELSAGVLNVAGADYRLSPLNLYAELPRDRVFFTQLKFQF
jgi:tetratricopeptide (TPR) repeat protein